jgi:hypothetical protein
MYRQSISASKLYYLAWSSHKSVACQTFPLLLFSLTRPILPHNTSTPLSQQMIGLHSPVCPMTPRVRPETIKGPSCCALVSSLVLNWVHGSVINLTTASRESAPPNRRAKQKKSYTNLPMSQSQSPTLIAASSARLSLSRVRAFHSALFAHMISFFSLKPASTKHF